MGLEAGNPVVGGTILRRAAIESPNFVHNVAGWAINQDGSAEFSNLVIRGTFLGTDWELTSQGLFFYNGTPALGNLIAYDSNVNGVDGHGNPISVGTASIDTVFGGQILLNGARFQLSSGINVRITMDPGGINLLNIHGAVIIRLDANLDAVFLYADTGSVTQGDLIQSLSVAGGIDPINGQAYDPGIEVFGGNRTLKSVMASASLTLSKTSGVFAPPAVNVQDNVLGNAVSLGSVQLSYLLGAAANILRSQLSTDTGTRFTISESGAFNWGPGTPVLDTTLYRNAAGFLACSALLADIGGTADTPHSISVSPGYVNSWLDGGRMPGKFRLSPAPANTLDMAGSLLVPAGVAAGQAITGALPVTYTPANLHSFVAINVTNSLPVRLTYTTGRVLQFSGPIANVAAGNIIDFDALIRLNF